jgi:hypothetical protein
MLQDNQNYSDMKTAYGQNNNQENRAVCSMTVNTNILKKIFGN